MRPRNPCLTSVRSLQRPERSKRLQDAGQQPHEFLKRHVRGDWGDLDEEDRSLNNAAVIDGSRILSVYQTRKGTKLWVITEATNDVGLRYSSTLLLPEDY